MENVSVSCPGFETVYYGNHGTELLLRDCAKCVLEHIEPLSWKKEAEGLETPWADALRGGAGLHGGALHL